MQNTLTQLGCIHLLLFQQVYCSFHFQKHTINLFRWAHPKKFTHPSYGISDLKHGDLKAGLQSRGKISNSKFLIPTFQNFRLLNIKGMKFGC